MILSAITTSDAGADIGYTTLRIRGTDGRKSMSPPTVFLSMMQKATRILGKLT